MNMAIYLSVHECVYLIVKPDYDLEKDILSHTVQSSEFIPLLLSKIKRTCFCLFPVRLDFHTR